MARRGKRGVADAIGASRNKARSQNRPPKGLRPKCVPAVLRRLPIHRVLCRLAGTHFGQQRGWRGMMRWVLTEQPSPPTLSTGRLFNSCRQIHRFELAQNPTRQRRIVAIATGDTQIVGVEDLN